jgi:hypothetical protein
VKIEDMPSGADNFDEEKPKYWTRGMTLNQMQSEIDELSKVDAKRYLYETRFTSWEVFAATFPPYCTEESLSHIWKVRTSKKCISTFIWACHLMFLV